MTQIVCSALKLKQITCDWRELKRHFLLPYQWMKQSGCSDSWSVLSPGCEQRGRWGRCPHWAGWAGSCWWSRLWSGQPGCIRCSSLGWCRLPWTCCWSPLPTCVVLSGCCVCSSGSWLLERMQESPGCLWALMCITYLSRGYFIGGSGCGMIIEICGSSMWVNQSDTCLLFSHLPQLWKLHCLWCTARIWLSRRWEEFERCIAGVYLRGKKVE